MEPNPQPVARQPRRCWAFKPHFRVVSKVRDDDGNVVSEQVREYNCLKDMADECGLNYGTLRHYYRQTKVGRTVKSDRYTDHTITAIAPLPGPRRTDSSDDSTRSG